MGAFVLRCSILLMVLTLSFGTRISEAASVNVADASTLFLQLDTVNAAGGGTAGTLWLAESDADGAPSTQYFSSAIGSVALAQLVQFGSDHHRPVVLSVDTASCLLGVCGEVLGVQVGAEVTALDVSKMSIDTALKIVGAVLLLWSVAFGIRAAIRVFNEKELNDE